MDREAIQAKLKALTLKERCLITMMVIVVIYVIWDFSFYQPLVKQFESRQAEVDNKQNAIDTLNNQLQTIVSGPAQKRHIANQKRYEEIVRELGITEDKLQAITANLIPPESMSDVLKTMLLKSDKLQVQRLAGLGSSPFPEKVEEKKSEEISFAQQKADVEARKQQMHQAAEMMDMDPASLENFGQAPPTVGQQMVKQFSGQAELEQPEKENIDNDEGNPHAWRHGFRLEFSGTYLDTLAYLRDLESLGWKFYWESLELKAENYPTVETSLEVFTLSLDESWLKAGN